MTLSERVQLEKAGGERVRARAKMEDVKTRDLPDMAE